MESHEGPKMIKTFRGLIVDGGQDTIVLHTNDGSTGYRIVNFRVFPTKPGQENVENTMVVWKVKQTTVSDSAITVDFSDNTMLAVGTFHEAHADSLIGEDIVIFDREIFNQDIYITHTDTIGAVACNYYLELEQVKLDLSENTVATLKDIRNVKTQGF
jgi:hypothetical protein